MGQLIGEVKSAATYKTTSSEEEDFAFAVARFVLANRLAGRNQFFSQNHRDLGGGDRSLFSGFLEVLFRG